MSATVTRPYKSEIVWRLRDRINEELVELTPVTEVSHVYRVVVGKYTEDLRGIVCSVHGTHPLGFDGGRHDSNAEGTPRQLHERGWILPAESIGGSQWETCYGTVQIRCLLKVPPSYAEEIIQEVIMRIAVIINDGENIVPFTDPFGYTVFSLRTSQSYGYAGGGDNTTVDSYWCDWIARAERRRSR
jgi:hypothetical protein